MINLWYKYIHLVDFFGFHVGKYVSFPFDPTYPTGAVLSKAYWVLKLSRWNNDRFRLLTAYVKSVVFKLRVSHG